MKAKFFGPLSVFVGLLVQSVAALPTLASRQQINSNTSEACTGCTNLGNFHDPLPVYPSDPVVQLANGPYAGIRLESVPAASTLSKFGVSHPQDLFLGIPYASQPTGSKRFARPAVYNETWSTPRSAKRYSAHCFGAGPDDIYAQPYATYHSGEECLTVNVVRPAGTPTPVSGLPVGVWIHGGAFVQGGSSDRRLNGSFTVDHAVTLGEPMLFVSFNYRKHILGFPVGDEAVEQGFANLGLYDQRLTLHWVQQNIAAFGGDPAKVTIWGESAGGASILFHMSAYNGRDDGLYRSAIAESSYCATVPRTVANKANYNQVWQRFLESNKCQDGDVATPLECLRKLPFEQIRQYSLQNVATASYWNPLVDGDMVADDLQHLFLNGQYVRNKPLLIHNNLDEGTAFGVRNINTDQDIINYVSQGNFFGAQFFPDGQFDHAAQKAVLEAYPVGESRYPPYNAGTNWTGDSGHMDRRLSGILGDLTFIGPRRQIAEIVSSRGDPVYVSRFDQVPYYYSPTAVGSTHYSEVAYVFRNPLATQNSLGTGKNDIDLSNMINEYWIRFIASQDPNPTVPTTSTPPHWPRYSMHDGRKFIKLINHQAHDQTTEVNHDTYRTEGIRFFNDIRAGRFEAQDEYPGQTC